MYMIIFLRVIRFLIFIVAIIETFNAIKFFYIMEMPDYFTDAVFESIPSIATVLLFIKSREWINKKAGKSVIKNHFEF